MTQEQPDYIGHRQRLRARFLAGGGKDMPDYEFLELLLMIAIPRKDVKRIYHYDKLLLVPKSVILPKTF